jgi:hypothetical protein
MNSLKDIVGRVTAHAFNDELEKIAASLATGKAVVGALSKRHPVGGGYRGSTGLSVDRQGRVVIDPRRQIDRAAYQQPVEAVTGKGTRTGDQLRRIRGTANELMARTSGKIKSLEGLNPTSEKGIAMKAEQMKKLKATLQRQSDVANEADKATQLWHRANWGGQLDLLRRPYGGASAFSPPKPTPQPASQPRKASRDSSTLPDSVLSFLKNKGIL